MKELEYPFDNGFIMKKKRSLKRQLLGDGAVRLKVLSIGIRTVLAGRCVLKRGA